MDTKRIGVLAVLAASLMWAIEPIFAKLACKNATIIQTGAIRAIVGVLVATVYVLVSKKATFRIPLKQLPKLVYLGIAGAACADLLYLWALTSIPVLNAVLVAHMQPIFIIFIGYFILKEDKLTKYDYAGVLIMILAGLMVTTKTTDNLSRLKLGTTGDLVVLGSSVIWASMAIMARKYLTGLHAGVLAFHRFLIASIVLTVYLLSTSSLVLDNIHQVILGLVVGVGIILYFEGLRRIKAVQVSALELATPFFAALLAFLILGELVTPMQMMGIVLLVVGIHFLSRREKAGSS